MTDSLWSIADIVQAKAAHAAECNVVAKSRVVEDKLHQIKESMVEPLDAVKMAQAYLSSQDLYKQFRHDNEMHLIMLLIRDLCCLLVLSVRMEDGLLEDKLNNVFKTSCLHLAENPKAKSQLLNAFNKIKTFGKSRDEFNKNLGLTQQEVPPPVEAPRKKPQKPHPYKDLTKTQQDLIFKAFSDCAPLIPPRRMRKRRPRKISSGKVVEGNDEVILEAVGEKLQRMHHGFSLLNEQRKHSTRLDAAIFLKIADISKELAEYLESNICCMDFEKSSCVSF